MDRRMFLETLAGGLLVAPLAADAQQAGKVARVGILWAGSPGASPNTPLEVADALRGLGWVESQNLVIDHRYAEGRVERFRDLAADLVRLKVDVVVAGGGPASLRAASEATKTIPIVMVAASGDPIGEGFIASYARPGGNITGLLTGPEEFWGKRLGLLKEAVPGLSRAGLLWDVNLGRRVFDFMWTPTEEAARSLRVELRSLEVREPSEFDRVIRGAVAQRVGGLIVAGGSMTFRHRMEIAALLTKHRMPAITLFRQQAEAGILMAYGASLVAVYRDAARYIDKILKGAKPADLPVEQPTKFDLIINLKTAKALGLTIPPSLLARADHVIDP